LPPVATAWLSDLVGELSTRRGPNSDLTVALFTAEPGSKSEEALNLLASRGSDADRARHPDGEH
jgi:hypothetical protein